MKFAVTGNIRRKTQFTVEVEAKSSTHAKALALMKLGSTQGISKNNIIIDSVKKADAVASPKK